VETAEATTHIERAIEEATTTIEAIGIPKAIDGSSGLVFFE
jgi:hypothetical protein